MDVFVGEVTNCYTGRSFVIGYRPIQASVSGDDSVTRHGNWINRKSVHQTIAKQA